MIDWFELVWRKKQARRELLMIEVIEKSELIGESVEDLMGVEDG